MNYILIYFKIVGKQPNDDTWVFNPTVQIDGKGECIPLSERKYVTTECNNLPYLWDVNNGKLDMLWQALFVAFVFEFNSNFITILIKRN